MKVLYLVTRSLNPKGTGQTRWAVRWKPALNAFAITFEDRLPAAENRHRAPRGSGCVRVDHELGEREAFGRRYFTINAVGGTPTPKSWSTRTAGRPT